FDAIVRPGQYRHRILSRRVAPADVGQRCDVKALKNPCWQNPLVLAGREKCTRTFTPNTCDYRIKNYRTRCRTRRIEGYNMA
ncbi:MAG TPA: hypothetical protein VE865_09030, partial [Bradyrhizobium sp.]|nr:hypothetical protein [Bradyrhizobium sp.]